MVLLETIQASKLSRYLHNYGLAFLTCSSVHIQVLATTNCLKLASIRFVNSNLLISLIQTTEILLYWNVFLNVMQFCLSSAGNFFIL